MAHHRCHSRLIVCVEGSRFCDTSSLSFMIDCLCGGVDILWHIIDCLCGGVEAP